MYYIRLIEFVSRLGLLKAMKINMLAARFDTPARSHSGFVNAALVMTRRSNRRQADGVSYHPLRRMTPAARSARRSSIFARLLASMSDGAWPDSAHRHVP